MKHGVRHRGVWRGPKTKERKMTQANPGTKLPGANIRNAPSWLPNSPKTCAAPPWRVAHDMFSEIAPQDARTPREACRNARPAPVVDARAHASSTPAHTRPSRGDAHAPAHVVRVTRDAASASAAGRFGVEVGGKHHGTYVRTAQGGGETFHSTKCGRPPAPGRPLGTVASTAIWARVGTHLSTPAGGATSLSAAVPPASGRRPSAFPKPQRPQVCCSHLRRRHRRASLLRNQQSKWWKLVDGTGLSYRQPGQDGRH